MAASTSYPKIPSKAWRTLRTRASSAPSTKFTANTVAALLSMANPKSAADNIVYPLRRLGLFNEDGGLTERGGKWRVDATYGEACQEILDEIYPDELTGLTDANGVPDRDKLQTWFQHQGFGGSNARQMAATYVMIAERRVPEAPDPDTKKPRMGESAKRTRQPSSVQAEVRRNEASTAVESGQPLEAVPGGRATVLMCISTFKSTYPQVRALIKSIKFSLAWPSICIKNDSRKLSTSRGRPGTKPCR